MSEDTRTKRPDQQRRTATSREIERFQRLNLKRSAPERIAQGLDALQSAIRTDVKSGTLSRARANVMTRLVGHMRTAVRLKQGSVPSDDEILKTVLDNAGDSTRTLTRAGSRRAKTR
jgi:hypothetical protein